MTRNPGSSRDTVPKQVQRDDILCVVITYNSECYIETCLLAAHVAGLKNITVWDNSSSDGTVERILSSGYDVRLVKSPENLGFGRAVNAAVAAAEWNGSVLALNPDCLLTDATLGSLIEALNHNPKCGLVSPAMTYPDDVSGAAGGAYPTLTKELLAWTRVDELAPKRAVDHAVRMARRLGVGRSLTAHFAARDSDILKEFDWVCGFCMLIRAEVWREVGGFDEEFFLYFEDVALCHRIRESGWTVLSDGRVHAVHDESASTRGAGKSKHYHTAMWKYFSNYGTPLQRRIARSWWRR